MSALVKATEELTSTAVVLLFQNLICFLLILPIALRGGLDREVRLARAARRQRHRGLVRPLHQLRGDLISSTRYW